MAGAQYIGAAPHVRDLFIDQRQKEFVAGRRGRSCLTSPKAAGKRVSAACQCALVRLADSATQGIAATVAIVFISIFISLLLLTSQGNN
jgi:hypothetical protein